MATAPVSRPEAIIFLLLKLIEAQGTVNPLDASKTSEEWPATAGPALTARSIRERLSAVRKDAIQRGLVNEKFSIPCSKYQGTKGTTSKCRQQAQSSKKRARQEQDDDGVKGAADGGSDSNKEVAVATPNSNHRYPSPPSTKRTKSRSKFVAKTAAWPSTALKGLHTPDETTCEVELNSDQTDSDSDPLADFENTPSKAPARKRTLPARSTRVGSNYYGDAEVDAGGADESDDEFDPFKVREEQEKKEAKRNRVRSYMKDTDDSD